MADYYGISKQLEKKFLLVCALEVETQGQLHDYDVLYTGVGKVMQHSNLHKSSVSMVVIFHTI